MRRPQARFVVTVAAVTLVLAAVLPALAQQRALDHDDVLQWNTIEDPSPVAGRQLAGLRPSPPWRATRRLP